MSEAKGLLDLACDHIAQVPSDFPTKALDLETDLDGDLRKQVRYFFMGVKYGGKRLMCCFVDVVFIGAWV